MPASANETLQDDAIRHALHAQKYGRGLADKIVRLLNTADDDLTAKIAARLALIDKNGFDLGPATTKRLQGLLNEIRTINTGVYQKVANGLSDELHDYAQYEAEWAGEGLKSALGVDLDINLPTATYLKTLVEKSPIDGHLLASWTDHMSTARQGRVEQAIRTGLVQGETIDAIVNRVRGTKANQFKDGVLNISRNSAQTLALTASSTVANNARNAVYHRNSKVVRSLKWISTLDSRTSPVCQSRDGTLYPIEQPHPSPPAHPRCRSILIPVTRSFNELGIAKDEVSPGTRASIDGQVPANTSFGDWIARQSEARQTEVFGKERADLLRSGKVSFQDLFREDGSYRSLDELRQREGVAAKPTPAPAPAPAPEPVQPKAFSPIDPRVSEATIEVQPRKDVVKQLSSRLGNAAKDERYDPRPEFKGVKAEMFGKASLPPAFTDEAASALLAVMPELDTLADAFGVPRVRAIRPISEKGTAIANMGDGVLGVHPTYFNAFASKVADGAVSGAEAKIAAYQSEMDEIRVKLEAMKTEVMAAKEAGKTDRYFEIYADQGPLIKRYQELSKKHFEAKRQARKAEKASSDTVSGWRPGDDPAKRPYNAVDYFTGIDRMRTVLYHEFGHQVHQMRAKTGRRALVGLPPLEKRLRSMYVAKFHKLGEGLEAKKLVSTTYATTAPEEWWAESFALYMMGRKDLVDDDLIKLIEEILNE